MYKLILFGSGSNCKDFLSKINYGKVDILACVDNNVALQGSLIENIKIISPNAISKYSYDYIIITNRFYDDIYQQLLNLGISNEKILGTKLYNNSFVEVINGDNIILNEFCSYPIEPYAICNMQNLGRDRHVDVYESGDYVRISSLELAAKEIYDNNIKGNIAELGVFKGDFAKILNEVFYDRKLFLFDTFKGFSEQDLLIENNNNLSISDTNDFAKTSIELVLSKMKFPQNCIIKKGYFPDTAENVDEQFAFVSIDADLFNPIYSGLEYFYPRMVKGGYIFIHDYNNARFKGAKEAVRKYCNENSIGYFPLSDISGTAVIIK